MVKKYIIVQTHTNKKQVCEDISRSLIEKRMAACVNIYPAVLSIYRYNSEVVEDNEYLVHVKTTTEKFNEISEPDLHLDSFYNYTKESGKARCTLYFILKYLIDLNTNIINENTKISIPWIMPQTEKNINMYKKMGFSIIYDDSYRDPYVNNKPQTIKELIKNLEKWCEEENDIEHSSKKQKTNLRGSGCKRKTKKKKCINKKAKTNKNKRQRKRKS